MAWRSATSPRSAIASSASSVGVRAMFSRESSIVWSATSIMPCWCIKSRYRGTSRKLDRMITKKESRYGLSLFSFAFQCWTRSMFADHAVLVHQVKVPWDFAKIGSHDHEEGIEVRSVALQFCLPVLDTIDVRQHLIQVGAVAKAIVGGACTAIDRHGDVGEGSSNQPFGPFVIDQCAVGADAQYGAPDDFRHIVDQLAESPDGEDLAALNAKRGQVGIECPEFASQHLADLGRVQQVLAAF